MSSTKSRKRDLSDLSAPVSKPVAKKRKIEEDDEDDTKKDEKPVYLDTFFLICFGIINNTFIIITGMRHLQ